MFALGLPATVPAGAQALPGLVLQRSEPTRERYRYELTSYTRYRTGTLAPAVRASALQLPDDLSPRVRALANQWRRRAESPQAVVQAALRYFREENFVYTLTPPLLGGDPVDEFLFSVRRGFCEHYASAFVTLMRAAGVPSRVVLGYLGGENNAAGGYLIVRQADAHAWAEVWLPGHGWTRVDPTGAVAPERIEHGIDAVRRLEAQGMTPGSLPSAAVLRVLELGWFARTWNATRLYWDLMNVSWYRWVADYTSERQERFLARFGFERVSWIGMLAALVGGVALFLLAYAVLLLRGKKHRDPVQAAYRRFCKKLARAGLVRAPNEGALAFARRCTQKRPELQPAIEAVTQLYLRLRYGRFPAKENLAVLKQRVAAFKVSER